MSSILDYRGYSADIVFDAEGGVFTGMVVGIHDGLIFEADSHAAAVQAFHEAIDDYLAFCEMKSKLPETTV